MLTTCPATYNAITYLLLILLISFFLENQRNLLARMKGDENNVLL